MFVAPAGLEACLPENKELRFKLLRMQLEALVKSGEEKAAEQALETFKQVIPSVRYFAPDMFAVLLHFLSLKNRWK